MANKEHEGGLAEKEEEELSGLADPDAKSVQPEDISPQDKEIVYDRVRRLAPNPHQHPEAAEIHRLILEGQTPKEIFEADPDLGEWYRKTFLEPPSD